MTEPTWKEETGRRIRQAGEQVIGKGEGRIGNRHRRIHRL